jgi:hypothetical protein
MPSPLLLRSSRKIIPNLKAATTTLLLASSGLVSGFPTFTNTFTKFHNMSTSSTAKYSTNLEVVQFQCLDDNYGYLIHDSETGCTAAIDTPDADAYQKQLDDRGWKLSHIFWYVEDS